eukprot:1634162-Amphidinium_carterae.1
MAAAAWASAPTQPSLVICNSTMRFAVRRQLMYPSKGQGLPCQQWKHRPDEAGLVTPQRCHHPLDAFSHHAQRFAQEAGYTALAEQFALTATTLPQDQEAASSTTRRGHERADLHLVSPGGQDQYIDIRVTTVPYAADVHLHLLDQERQKRSQYYRADVTPAVLSTLGQLAPDLHRLLQELTFEQARRSLHDDTTWAAQLASARLAILQPLSVLLLRNTAVAEGTCLGDARARGNVAPTLAASSAVSPAFCAPTTAHDALEGPTQIDPPATICVTPTEPSSTVPEPAAASASSPQPC